MSEARGLLRHVRVSEAACPVTDVSRVPDAFVETVLPIAPQGSEAVFPRSWSQLEQVVEARLQAFESRHQSECREAFEQGRQEGRREQLAEVDQRLAAASMPWQSLQESVRGRLEVLENELYLGTAELAAALSRAWLGAMVEINPRVFEAGLRKALEALGPQEHIEVKLHPDDCAAFKASLHDPDGRLWDAPELTVTPDPSVDRGGAVASSRGGTSDARLAVRVQKALEWLHHQHEPRT